MPIKPENAARYPKDWPAISYRIRQRAGNCCEFCGIDNGALGGRLDGVWFTALPLGEKLRGLEWPRPGDESFCTNGKVTVRLRIVRIVLTVAHLNHIPEDCRDENLKALCQRCHLAYDHKHHQSNAYQTRRKGKAIGDLIG